MSLLLLFSSGGGTVFTYGGSGGVVFSGTASYIFTPNPPPQPPSADRIALALSGQLGPVIMDIRFERRNHAGALIDDVTRAFNKNVGSIEANNDRPVFRTATFRINPDIVELEILHDHIYVVYEIMVDGWQIDMPQGLFHMHLPTMTRGPVSDEWEVQASDLTIHMAIASVKERYTVATGTNYMVAVATILDMFGIRYVLPESADTVPAPGMTWPIGTSWLTILTDILEADGFMMGWMDKTGVFRTRRSDTLTHRTPDVEYDGAWIKEPFVPAQDESRFANVVIGVTTDPSQPLLEAIAINNDPDNPVSVINLGYEVTKYLEYDTMSSQQALEDRLQIELEESSAFYERAQMTTVQDPRRDGREVYSITLEPYYDQVKYFVRNWTLPIAIGQEMQHNLSRVQKLA